MKPAPWRTWWAWLGYALAFAGLGYGGFRFRLRALRERNTELEARVMLRTRELDGKNEELAVNLRQLEAAQAEAVRQNAALDQKVVELAKKNHALEESHRRADLIFSALADVLPGTVLDGKYRLEEKIGTGGFGAVFRATHLALGRAVAVKVFRPAQGNDSPLALERFRLEGMSACRVDHPNAVNVFDSGISQEGIAYLVMELLVGQSLAEELRQGTTISLRRCARILAQICDVLEAAHKGGLVHRDIKPDNVFLHRAKWGDEQVKVVDFGIAKLMGYDAASGEAGITATGGIIGTPSYMAPERFSADTYDARSDVYSVGVTAFEMVTRSLPFPVETRPIIDVVLRQLTAEPLDVKALNPLVPEGAAALLMRCIARDPAERPTLAALSSGFSAAVDALPDAAKDAVTVAPRSRVSIESLDEHSETVSHDAPTQARNKASMPPPPSKRAG